MCGVFLSWSLPQEMYREIRIDNLTPQAGKPRTGRRTDRGTVIQQIMCAQSPETFQKVGNRDGSRIESRNQPGGMVERSERNELKFVGGNGSENPPLPPSPSFRERRPIRPVITIRTKLCRIGAAAGMCQVFNQRRVESPYETMDGGQLPLRGLSFSTPVAT